MPSGLQSQSRKSRVEGFAEEKSGGATRPLPRDGDVEELRREESRVGVEILTFERVESRNRAKQIRESESYGFFFRLCIPD